MKRAVLCLTILLMLCCSFSSCNESEPPIGGDLNSRDMTLSVIRVFCGDTEKDFTTNTRKREILAIVNEVLTSEEYTDNVSVPQTLPDGNYHISFVYIEAEEDKNVEYRLTANLLVDIAAGRAYSITEAQRAALVAILDLVPAPGQTL